MAHGEMISEVYGDSFRRLVVQLYALTGDLGEAQEVVQEAFVRALSAPRGFAELENPEAWLRKVAVNLARTRWRRRRILDRLLRRVAPDPVVPDASPDHIALLSALRELPAGQRHALTLHYLSDLPIDEVARTLDVSVGTVKSRLHRGRAALAALLTDPLDADVPQPPLEQLAVRATRRRARRRAGALAAVVLAVVGAIAAGQFLPRQSPLPTPADSSPPAPNVSPQVTSAVFFFDNQPDLVTLFDSKTVVIVQRSCMIRLRVTTDAGRNWSQWRLPVQTIDCLGEKDATFELLSPTTYVATVIGRTYLTGDSGRTWREWKPTVYAVPGIPDHRTPRGCDGCETGFFEAVAPDGSVLRTIGQPGLRSWSLTREVSGGSFWLLGHDRDGSSAVARTDDRGWSWTTTRLPANLFNATLAAADARVAYVVGELAGHEVVYRTTDGGGEWTEIRAAQLQPLADARTRPSASAYGRWLLVLSPTGGFWINDGAEGNEMRAATAQPFPEYTGVGGTARSGPIIWVLGVNGDIHTSDKGRISGLAIPGPPSR